MKWMRTLWRWSSLGISVAAVGGLAVAGKHWAEQHALEAVLGHGARTDALTVHWSYSAGCAENVCIPLSAAGDAQTKSQLSARRLWFTYDLPALMRKRVVLPRVIIEDAHIVAAAMQPSTQSGSPASEASAEAQPLAWLEKLHSQLAALEEDKFISGTQVAIDTAMLSEQWQANFADVHQRAQRILTEAKDIQQELTAIDNPLRHEARVIASRGRLEELRTELAGLKNSLLKTDKILREQQSRIREALLTEKRALQEAGSAFQSPPASDFAAFTVNGWLAACMTEPAQYSILLGNLMCAPFRPSESLRGTNIRHADPMTADFAARSAKIAGDISLAGLSPMPTHRAPFTASGSFEVLSPAGTAGDANSGASARWQMVVGRSLNCISLEGEARNPRDGVAAIELESNAPGQLEANCEVAKSDVVGTAQVRLRQWLADRSHATAINPMLVDDPLASELLEAALADLNQAPQEVQFRFASQGGVARAILGKEDAHWLANALARVAAAHVAEKYEAAVEKLDAHVVSELEAMNRSVAVSYNAESQNLQQLLQELKVLQADVMNNLAQRAGSEFARKSAGDVVR